MNSFRYHHLMKILRYLFLLLAFTFCNVMAFAQTDGGATGSAGSDSTFEVGFHLGNLLPNQIGGVQEIMGLGGVRLGMRFAPSTYFEAGVISGNGEGVEWKDAHVDVRMDIPIENLVGIAYVGADTVYYNGNGHSNKLVFGGHAGGGFQAHVGGSLWFRGDMKFGFNPGTSLYIGAGFVFRM